ncbi:MAG TPA: hypothetical protein VF008_26845 [Niastella sp.]
MKRFSLIALCCMLAIPVWTAAQTIDPQVSSTYPPSIVVRVHDVASRIKLEKDMQQQLARHFAHTDSLMATAIIKGAGSGEVRTIELIAEADFRNLLGPSLEYEYYSRKVSNNAWLEAKVFSTIMKKKYNTDTTVAKTLLNEYYRRKMETDRTLLQYAGTAELYNRLTDVVAAGDSIYEHRMQILKMRAFINEKLAVLHSIKPLAQSEAGNLEKNFFALYSRKRDGSLTDHFNEALRKTITDTVYFAALFREDIEKQSNVNTKRVMVRLSKEKQITPRGFDPVKDAVYAKEMALATLQYAFPYYTRYKDSLILLATRNGDSLITLALMKDGSFPIPSRFSIAIKNRQKLGLTAAQEDSLFGHAVAIELRRNEYAEKFPLGKFDQAPYEAMYISTILTDDQHRMVLAEKHKTLASEWARGDWEELRKRGMTDGYDSMVVITQITQYNTNRLVARDLYAANKILQNAYINDIDNNIPAALRKLRSVRNRDNVANATKPKETTATFKW